MQRENGFIRSIHHYLSPSVYREKMHNAYHGGTPDVWYSGSKTDLWIEYKFILSVPKIVIPKLTPLQLHWLTERKKEGRNVAVIIGTVSGGVLITSQTTWVEGISKEIFLDSITNRKQLAEIIERKVNT